MPASRESCLPPYRCESPVPRTDDGTATPPGHVCSAPTACAAPRASIHSTPPPCVGSARRSSARCPHGTESPRLLIGRDTRESGGWIEAELAHGASGEGASVTSAGVVPTPAIAYLTPDRGIRRGRGDLRVAQSVRRQRHQGVLRPRREVHRAGRAGSRGDRRRLVMDGAGAAKPAPCRRPISRAPTWIICARVCRAATR